MRWALAGLLLPAVVFAALSPDTIARSILTASDWQYVAQKVATGDRAWLDTVPSLAHKADRHQAEMLEDALATALPLNTKAVLSTLHILDAGTYPEMEGTNTVCILKVVRPGKEAEAYYNDTRLRLLDEPNGAQCLWNMESVWAEIQRP